MPAPDAATIALIGLGQSARDVGRALAGLRTGYTLLGHDRDAERARSAQAAGAVDRIVFNLPAAVEDADLVILGEPVGEALETLGVIAPHLKAGAVVTDLAPGKAAILARAAEALPASVSFIGGHPVLAPGDGAADARFRGATWCLCAPPGAAPAALRTVERLVRALGAEPFYIDAAEHDALAAGALRLPQLEALALLSVLRASPASGDLRRLGGGALMARLDLAEDTAGLGAGDDRAALLRWLDAHLAALAGLRAALADGGAAWETWRAGSQAELRAWQGGGDPHAAYDEAMREAQSSGMRRLLMGSRRRTPGMGEG